MPQDELKRKREMKMFEIITEKEGLGIFRMETRVMYILQFGSQKLDRMYALHYAVFH